MCLALLPASALSSGCQQQPRAEQRLSERTGSMARVIDGVARDESRRPARLAAMARRIDREARNDSAKLDRDIRELGRLTNQEVREWNQMQPRMWKAVGRELWGKPEHIETTFIDLFY